MLAIVFLLGAAFYQIDRYSVRLYYEELSQRLNSSLAMYVVNAEPLINGGQVNAAALSELAGRAMIINPTAEIYLLAPDGAILGHAFAPEEIDVDRIDVGPIRDLLSESRQLPITGADPRKPGTRKIFSAFPVVDPESANSDAGYLYVVLGGSQYEVIAEQVSSSDKQRMVTAGIFLLVLAAFIGGTLLFSFLTRRLRNLTADVTEFTEPHLETNNPIERVAEPGDEIDQLRNACHYMATTIRQQMSSLRASDRLRRDLVTNISHDLRTPLATMQGYIETLIIKDEVLDAATRRQYLQTANKHATHLSNLIQGLFDLAMLDSGNATPAFEQFSLTELIHDVAQEFRLQADERQVLLQVDPPEEVVSVCADISLIQRVLENLVGNALKYTPHGGKVSISVRPSSSAVGVSVADTGAGISEQALPHIFDRFFSEGCEADDDKGSTGLGLAIAKKILELHGSEIRVTSEEQRGTRFDFDLPLQARAA
jgi:signal transduction histidine kinase